MSVNTSYSPDVATLMAHKDVTFGPWFIGGVADFLLQGALVMMTVDYYQMYPDDSTFLKTLVGSLSFLNVLRSIQTLAILWQKFVSGFGDWEHAALSPWTASAEPLVAEVISFIAHLYFIIRLYRLLGRNKLVLILTLPACLTGMAGSIALTTELSVNTSVYARFDFNTTVIIALAGVTVSDVLITGVASYYLLSSKTGFKRTDNLIHRLIRLTWLSALPPAICALLNLVLYVSLAKKSNLSFVAFNIMMPKLYSVSMMYTINSRAGLLKGDQYIMSSRTLDGLSTTGTFQFSHPSKNGFRQSGANGPKGLAMATLEGDSAVFTNDKKISPDEDAVSIQSIV